MSEVWDHPLRKELLLLLLLPQRELSLQLSMIRLRLSSITPNSSKTEKLSLRIATPHVQTTEVVSN